MGSSRIALLRRAYLRQRRHPVRAKYPLPLSLAIGDPMNWLSTGEYTTRYREVARFLERVGI